MLGRGPGQQIAAGPSTGFASVSRSVMSEYGAESMYALDKRANFRLSPPNRVAAPRAAMVNVENYSGVMYQRPSQSLVPGSRSQNSLMNRIRSSYAHFLPRSGS